jgi:hypothetical protein
LGGLVGIFPGMTFSICLRYDGILDSYTSGIGILILESFFSMLKGGTDSSHSFTFFYVVFEDSEASLSLGMLF